MDTCEVLRDGAWELMGIGEAMQSRNELLRCISCHGRVIPKRDCGDGAQPNFSHLQAFAYCSGDPDLKSQLHPHPLS